ncbi:helix-turn-helix domain-containing protein [Halioglobus maricola]|uniref:Helix-turn-helix domain-containing protein n=1 Tax=Halioglobus maricola TaxID=2601894 RepID=A0A5P9NL30_9GAMM|nr:helix-turn-helix domain-containing protein [Halioglobus maricola]QFU75944.1 helix-turn-helix domain-containing protein [Halioglobus maricola]
MTRLVFDSLDNLGAQLTVLDLVGDTHAWMKNAEGRFVYGNQLFVARFGMSSSRELLGKTDFDLAPQTMAQRYTDDDRRVLAGNAVSDRLEMIGSQGASLEWFLTSKWPVFNTAGNIVASFGMSRHLNRSERSAVPYRELDVPISYIQTHFAENVSVRELACASNLSVSALERRFRRHLGKTPHQYIVEVRLENARQLLLETDRPVGTIAIETGFADHSHLTRSFRKHFGCAPSSLRD